MQNYFGELKPYNSKYCSNFIFFGPQFIFAPFNIAVLFGSRNKGHTNIKGFTVYFVFSTDFMFLVKINW